MLLLCLDHWSVIEGPAGVDDDDSDTGGDFGGGVDHDLFGKIPGFRKNKTGIWLLPG